MLLMVFWDALDVILKFVVCGPTATAFSYCRTLWHLKEAIWMKQTFSPNFLCVGMD
jgi:hypothetical protein